MENSRIIQCTGIGLACIGALTSGIGLHLRGQASDMLAALEGGASLFGYDASTYRSMDIWEGKLNQNTIILIIGIAVLLLGAIMIYYGYLKANGAKHPEVERPAKDVTVRLRKLDEAKRLGMISDEEYEMKRKEIIAEF